MVAHFSFKLHAMTCDFFRRSTSTLAFIFFAFMFSVVSSNMAKAAIVLSNFPGNDGGVQLLSAGGGYSIGFTIGNSPLEITTVEFRLRSSSPSETASVELRSDNRSNPSSSAMLAFNSQTISNSPNFDNYTFTAQSSLQLAANTTYWLTLSTSSIQLEFAANSPLNTPTSPTSLASYFGARIGAFSDQSTDPATLVLPQDYFIPTLAINGVTAVPEPSAFVGFAILSGAIAIRNRRKMKKPSAI